MIPAGLAILRYLTGAARARRRRLALLRAVETILALAAVLAVGLVLLLVVEEARPWLLLALGCVATCGVGLGLGALLRRPRPLATARWIARRDPALGGALADAVQFTADLSAGRPAAGWTVSPQLARAHVEQAAARIQGAEPGRHARAALRGVPIGRAALALGVAAALLVALPDARRRLVHGSPLSAADVVSYGDVELTFRYPAYLRIAEHVERGTGDIVAPLGTHVGILLRADRALKLARLDTPDGPVEMSIDGNVATARLVITKDGAWSARLEGQRGGPDPGPPQHSIRALADAAPEIRLRTPSESEVILRPGEALELAWTATDDHGVAEIVEVISLDGADDALQALRQRVELVEPAVAMRSGERSISAHDLDLEEGQSRLVWLEARDDDEVSGPKWASSQRIRVTLAKSAAQEEEAEISTELTAERLLATLADHLVNEPSLATAPDQILSQHQRLSTSLGEITASLTTVIVALQRSDGDLVAMSALEEMRGRLDWMRRGRQRRIEEARARAPSQAGLAAAAAAIHPAEIEELERDVLFFDMWADRRASLRAADTTEALLEAIGRLQDELATLASPEFTGKASEALAETAALLEGLGPQIDQLAAAAGESERASEAREALQALRDGLAREVAAQSRKDLAGAREVAAHMERAARGLAEAVDDLASAGQMGDPELAAEMRRADGEIRRLRREQADLRDETNALRDETRGTLSPEDRRQIDETFRELLVLAEEAVAAEAKGERLLGEAPSVAQEFARLESRADGDRSDRLNLESLMRLSQASRDSLGRLRQVLADRQLDAARTPARWSLGALDLLQDELTREDRDDLEPARPAFEVAAARAATILSRLDELERQVERATQSRLTDAQRQRMDGLSRAQGELLGQARQLGSRLREMSADAPFLDDEVGSALDGASEQMNESASSLHGRKPGEASESQGEALAKLEEAGKALSPSPSEQRQGGRRPGQRANGDRERQRGRESRFGRFSRDEVEIPDAEDYRVPKEFREEILAAMRSSTAPAGYEEQVREYYRRLVE